jgi:outer membrane protein
MTPLRLLPLSLALGAAFAAPAHAQSLVELYEAARAYDATWQSAKSQYDANLFRAEQARAGILPSANLSAGASRTNSEVRTPPSERDFTSQNRHAERLRSRCTAQPTWPPMNRAKSRHRSWRRRS